MVASKALLAAAALITSVVAAPAAAAKVCPAEKRQASAEQVIYAYNLKNLGESEAAFKKVPWGNPDSAGECLTTIIPDGTDCYIPVATTGSGTYQFAVESRQVFSHLTGEYINFPNGTTLINTNVTLGVRSNVPLPVTFLGHVYMDYAADCRIYSARAFAEVPTKVLGEAFSAAGLSLPPAVCGSLPV